MAQKYAVRRRLIHIQNPHFRFCVNESVFVEMCSAIKKSESILRKNKHIEER